jgi:ABC-2 type transport system ATP-binding protein
MGPIQSSSGVAEDRPLPSHGSDGSAVPAIRAVGLTKVYRGHWTLRATIGLDALSLEVQRGEVLGLLGPNGAGKSTTLKLLTGLLKPSRGQAWLFGESVEHPRSRRKLGFLPEQPYFYDYLSGLEYLEFVARLSGLSGVDASRRARHWLARVGLGERPGLRLRKYSKGMLQRLGLAAALVHDPELLILDEPMSGLDPFGRRDVRELILEQRARGVTVLFSSHILPDVEMLCDRVAIVLQGRLRRVATVGELVSQTDRVEVRCAGPVLLEVPREWSERIQLHERAHETVITLESGEFLNELLAWLIQRGVRVTAVTPQRSSLEDLFLAAARDERDASQPEGDATRRSA